MPRIQISGVIADYSSDGWDEFVKWLNGTYAKLQYVWTDEGEAYQIVAIDGGVSRVLSINKSDAGDFESSYKSRTPKQVHSAQQSDGAILVSEGANLAGSEFIRASHNFADRTTWYGDSVRVSDETLVDSGDGLTWNSEHAVWIDLVHGKILAEEDLTGYSVVVKVDGVTQTMRDPFADDFEDGGDYYVDYRSGDVIFEVSQAGHTVTASYSYENGSGWYLSPSTGKLLFLKEAEINISSDVELNDTIQYLIQAYVPGYGWVTVGSAEYRAGWQIIQECRGNHPVIPAFGGTARGTQHDVYQIPFVYVADRELKSSQGIRLNARLKAHKEFGGEHASITFYCLSRPEI